MPSKDQMLDPAMRSRLIDPLTPLNQVDLLDLERRVADLEDRARREDKAEAAKDRLGKMGLVFPGRV